MREDEVNLLEETLEAIRKSGHTVDDVSWVGSADGKYAISWEEFEEIAREVDYDSGFGAQEVACDLVVVFSDDTWLEREEYDGSEWWRYCRSPRRRPDARPFTEVACGMWYTLERLNRDGNNREA